MLNFEQLIERMLLQYPKLMTEMFVIGDVTEDELSIIAYQSKLWIINSNYENNKKVLHDIEATFKIELKNVINVEDLETKLVNQLPDNQELMMGYLKNGLLTITDKFPTFVKDHITSNLVKKVIKLLNPTEINYSSDPNNKIKTHNNFIRGEREMSKIMTYYHGTSTSHIISILKEGLDGDTLMSNWGDDVKYHTKGKIFMTSNYSYAKGHAKRTAIKNQSLPVIISFSVRFDDLMQPDYDMERIYGKERGLKISKSVGILAYSNRIYPYDIKKIDIFLDKFSDNNSNRLSIPTNIARMDLIDKKISIDDFIKSWKNTELHV